MDYEITPEEVNRLAQRGEAFELIDVREPWEFDIARIEGAKMMPMGDVPSRAHQELDPDIVVYLPSWSALDERDSLAPPTRIRESAIDGGRHRRLGQNR
jgi:hypothetical protein